MVFTQRRMNGTGDLPAIIQQAMGAGAKVPVAKPYVSLIIPAKELSITIQRDGQIAIFNRLGLIACECQGQVIDNFPSDTEVEAMLWHDNAPIMILVNGDQYYSRRDNVITALKKYDPTIKADRKSDPLAENDEDGGCVLWHTNDDSTIDYDRQIEEQTGEDFPLPRWGQPGQHDDDPKEGR